MQLAGPRGPGSTPSRIVTQGLGLHGKDLLGALTAFVPAPSVLAAPDGLLASLMGAEDGLDFEG
ncbi:hypothetical protein HaLaN_31164, partial [Haematococcus lacustris]